MAGERLNPTSIEQAVKANTETLSDIYLVDNLTYSGRDLTTIFADEIAGGDVWDWVQNRVNAGNYSGMRIGDFIKVKVGEETHDAQIAGCDTYFNTGGNETHGTNTTNGMTPIPHHIDFITRDCTKTTYQWNTLNINYGTSNADDGKDVPWLVSNIKAKLDELYNTLPENLKSHITSKVNLLERRGKQESTQLTASTGWHWYDMGKLWLPTEWEVFGSTVWATEGYGNAQTVQYPIFANSWKSRIKGAGPGGARCNWWLSSVGGHDSTGACNVTDTGTAIYWNASTQRCVPICFRVAAKSG